MMKVLAAEMSDPQRLRRGKQYAHDGSVLDIVIDPGVVTCEIQGSRSTPYIAQIEVAAGDGMPLRRDIRTRCTCPDDDNWDNHACKHVVAGMFALSDELLLEPELLDVWRQRDPSTAAPASAAAASAVTRSATSGRAHSPTTRGHLTLVHSDSSPPRGVPRDRPDVDPLAEFLRIPHAAELPAVPELDRVELPLPKRQELASLISDALRHVRVDWD
jgi:hypothetical protein